MAVSPTPSTPQEPPPPRAGRGSVAGRVHWRFWRYPIGVQSLIAVALGAAVGWAFPAVGGLKILGDAFLNAVQMVVVPWCSR